MISIELIDTGVKLATGFACSALFFVWYYRKRDMFDKRSRIDLDHRRQLLQQVGDKVGRVHHVYQQYLSLVIEYSRMGAHWPESRRKDLKRMTEELVEVFKELNSAEATLLLLGEKKLEKALRVYGARIVALRRQVNSGKMELSGEDLNHIEDNKREIHTLRSAFYDTLSDRFMMRQVA